MNKKYSLYLLGVFIFLLMIACPAEQLQAAPAMTLGELQEKFPNGKYWNHANTPGPWGNYSPDTVTDTPCTYHNYSDYSHFNSAINTCNGYDGAWQCMGYAYMLGAYSTGVSSVRNGAGWRAYEEGDARNYAASQLKPGDIVIYNISDTLEHTIFVTGITDQKVIFSDCNGTGSCMIRWNASLSKAYLYPRINFVRSSPGIIMDTEAPVISDIKLVSEDSEGFTISCVVTDNDRVAQVWFPTWTAYNDQDDITNPWQGASSRDGDTYYYRVYYRDHNNEQGTYITHIYAYDAAGNQTAVEFRADMPRNTITLTGNKATDIAAVAVSQVGYTEGENKSTIYGEWFGNQNEPWGASFVAWCANKAGISEDEIPKCRTVMSGESFRTVFGRWGRYFQIQNGANGGCDCGNYTAAVIEPTAILKGDLVLLETNNDVPDGPENVAIVVENGTADGVDVVIGNVNGKVVQTTVGIDQIHGVCAPAYNADHICEYEVSYHANGGGGVPANQTKTYGRDLTISSAVPTRTGYTFTGWNTKADGSGTAYASGATYTANEAVTLYAQWRAETYTVTYHANGGSGAPANQTKIYGNNLTISSAVPTRTGYSFTGWNTRADGSGTAYASGAIYTANEAVTLYAQWRAETYTVTYHANGGSGAPASQAKTYGNNLTISSAAPTRTGYTFTGWNTRADGSGTAYASGATYTANESVTLYAQWRRNQIVNNGVTVSNAGIYVAEQSKEKIVAGMTVTASDSSADLEYSWWACRDEGSWFMVQDWKTGDEWLNWTPAEFGDYTLKGKVRPVGNPSAEISASAAVSYHPHIIGKCQMPLGMLPGYEGQDGYLIGVETYDNPGQTYRYEMLILDCTLLAQGRDAWTYTTGQCRVAEGNALWTIWQPEYGYYWTLFRVFDQNGTMIDQECYGFANAY